MAIVPRYSREEFALRGDEIYDREVLPRLGPEDEGKFALVDIETGDYEVDRVKAGEHLIVVRGGRPIAELRSIPATRPGPRPFGLCAGAFTVPDDFDAPLSEEILRGFEGR